MPTLTKQQYETRLGRMENRRESIRQAAEHLCMEVRSAGREEFTLGEQERLAAMQADLRDLDQDIVETRQDAERSEIPERYRNLGGSERRVSSAGQLAPLGYTDEQLRRSFDQLHRGESAVLEARTTNTVTGLIPPDLGPILPVFPKHENRLLNKLPGISIDVPAIAYLEVTATSGSAAIVPEGGAKPELLMPATQQVATARKIAAHTGISWEAYSGDYLGYVNAVQVELMKKILDSENQQLYGGTGEANGQVNGLVSNANILTLAATGTTEFFTDLAGAIAALRAGPALASPDLCLMHPDTWASVRTAKDSYGRFLASVDPTSQTAETVWDVPVVQSTQFTAGEAVLLDSTQYGRVVVRESLVTRIGYAGTDFTDNVVRLLGEERLTQTIERPQAICKLTGLPTAAPTQTDTRRSTAKK
jgi:HK97 family phage major capsid protein